MNDSFPGSLYFETYDTDTPLVRRAHVLIVECNQIVHSINPDIKTGSALMAFVYGSYLKAFIDSRNDSHVMPLIYLVTDNYEKVPVEKFTTHVARAKRRAVQLAKLGMTQARVDAMVFTEESIPPVACIAVSSVLLNKCLLFIIDQLATRFARNDNLAVYVSCPSPREKGGAVVDSPFYHGQNVRLTPNGPEPPPPFYHGEGELIAHDAAAWVRTVYPTPNPCIHIVSCDNDNFPIVLLRPPSHSINLFVQLTPVKTAASEVSAAYGADAGPRKHRADTVVKMRRYIDCAKMLATIDPRADPKRPSHACATVAIVAILAGSDFVPGIKNIGPKTLWHTYRATPDDEHLFDGTTKTLRKTSISDFIARAYALRRKAAPPEPGAPIAPGAAHIINEVEWNVRYWS